MKLTLNFSIKMELNWFFTKKKKRERERSQGSHLSIEENEDFDVAAGGGENGGYGDGFGGFSVQELGEEKMPLDLGPILNTFGLQPILLQNASGPDIMSTLD